MTTIRTFAFIAAVLITAFLLRVFAYDLSTPQHDVATGSQHAVAGTPASSRSSAD
jgi:hypothetical protein